MPNAQAIFEILVREHADRLMAFLHAASPRGVAADDLFQETMLRAWRRLDAYDRSRPFGPWLRGIARLVVMESYRTVGHQADESLLQAIESRVTTFEGPAGTEFRERLAGLQACVQALPEAHAVVVDAVYRGGRPLEAVAQQLSENVETVKKRLQRARAQIAECLQRKGMLA